MLNKNFFLKLLTITAVIITIGLLLFNTCLNKYYFSAFPFIVIYFFALTYISHSILVKISNIRFAKFSSLYMLITGIKMFVNIGFLVLYIWLQPKFVFPFLISFLIIYFSYTVFEVVSLLLHFKQKNNPPVIVVH